MRILVTGATGKLGPHVVTALLQRDQDVRALGAQHRAGRRPSSRSRAGDRHLR